MFRFENPEYLWGLLLIPILVLMAYVSWRSRKTKIKQLGDIRLVTSLMPNYSIFRSWLKMGLLLLALALLVMMLARPQMGSKISHDHRSGIETIIALDISNSMLATDVAPSRLEKSKMLIENLVDHFTNDRIGLNVFAGAAYVQLPITSDYVSAKMFLQNIDPSLIQTQGTDIAGALDLAIHSFTSNDKVGKAVIVITDGEDHQGGAIEKAKEAKRLGINVFILGVGTVAGAPIPMPNGEYLKDNKGEVVITHLNENMCKEIAQAGSGKYIHVDNTSDAQEALNVELGRLQKGDTDTVVYSTYNEQFQSFGLLVILLLIAESIILEVKNPLFQHVHFFRK